MYFDDLDDPKLEDRLEQRGLTVHELRDLADELRIKTIAEVNDPAPASSNAERKD